MSRSRTHVGALAIVLACALAGTLLTAVPAGASSTGFKIYNLTSSPLKLFSIDTYGHGAFEVGRSAPLPPRVGDVLMPGQPPLHVELDYFLGRNTRADLRYEVPGDKHAVLSLFLNSHIEVGTDCASSTRDFQCIVKAGVITMLDPPGTVHNVSAGEKQEQADLLSQLCKNTSSAKCTFTPVRRIKAVNRRHMVGDALTACGPHKETETTVERTDKVGFTNSVDVAVGAETEFGILGQKVKASLKITYGHESLSEHEFKQDVKLTVEPGDIGWVAATQPVLRDTGDFTLEVGNTTWNLKDVSFESPDPRTDPPLGGFVTDSRTLPADEYARVCTHKEPGLTQVPDHFVQMQWKGTDGHDLLLAGAESHTVRGFAGNDLLRGGKGHDSLYGGRDDDTLNGGLGRDTLNGGRHDDVLDGGPGRDTLSGGTGADTMIDNRGPTRVQTGPDTGPGKDTVSVRDGRGDDTVICGSRRTTVIVDAGDSVIGPCGKVSRSVSTR
jgi:hypothetical protein